MTDLRTTLAPGARRYYHGGAPGLSAGDALRPPSQTGRATLLQYARQLPGCTQRADRVYVTTSSEAAAMFAFGYPFGTVYEVDPEGQLEDDPDCDLPGLSFQCASALILRVVQTGIGRDQRQFDRIMAALLS